MKIFSILKTLFLTMTLLLAANANASWRFNLDGGFGIYQPEGWSFKHNGRSSRLIGPANDSNQSEIFMGSDWVSHIENINDLRHYVQNETQSSRVASVRISEIDGFKVGTESKGAMYLLRVPENVIVIQYDLEGSSDQIDEGLTALSSIEIKKKAIEYP